MTSMLNDALAKKHLSDRKIGELVRKGWRQAGVRSRPSAVAIGAKFGLLRKGDATWWINHPAAEKVAAQLLGLQPGTLAKAAETRPVGFTFAEFGELTPLLPTDPPCKVREDGWLADKVRSFFRSGNRWVVASAGSGKSLAIWWLEREPSLDQAAITVRTLLEAARPARSCANLIVNVHQADPATDRIALEELTDRGKYICVMAPFVRPDLGEDLNAKWNDVEWAMAPGWRARFVQWVKDRLGEQTKLDVGEVLEWFDLIDPACSMIATPGELLPFLARAHRSGTPKVKDTLARLGDAWLTEVVSAGTRPTWLRARGSKVVRVLLNARLDRLDLGCSALSHEAWSGLVPAELAPAASVKAARQSIDAVAIEPSAKKRAEQAAEVAQAVAAGRPDDLVRGLGDAGLLRTQRDGLLDFYPTWVRVASERSETAKAIVRGEVGRWGLWAVDLSRRAAVDAALDGFRPGELAAIAARVLDSTQAGLAAVAAVEALFAAIGRRLLQAEWTPLADQVPALQRLGQRQVDLLAAFPSRQGPRPTTRSEPDPSREWFPRWLAEAWAFSFAIKGAEPVPDTLAWCLPGWTTSLRLANVPAWLPTPPFDRDKVTPHPPLAGVARTAVDACVDTVLPEKIPGLLLPWTVVLASAHKWQHTPQHWRHFFHGWAADFVGEQLEVEAEEVRRAVVATTWPALLADEKTTPLRALARLHESRPALFRTLTRTIGEAPFERDLAVTNLTSEDVEPLQLLPPRLQRCTLRVLARQLQASSDAAPPEVQRFVSAMEVEDVDLLASFASDRFVLGQASAARVWVLDPQRAHVEARAAVHRGDNAGSFAWFSSAPQGALGPLLDLIESRGTDSIGWAADWLPTRLSEAGPSMERVYALMQSARSPRPAPWR